MAANWKHCYLGMNYSSVLLCLLAPLLACLLLCSLPCSPLPRHQLIGRTACRDCGQREIGGIRLISGGINVLLACSDRASTIAINTTTYCIYSVNYCQWRHRVVCRRHSIVMRAAQDPKDVAQRVHTTQPVHPTQRVHTTQPVHTT